MFNDTQTRTNKNANRSKSTQTRNTLHVIDIPIMELQFLKMDQTASLQQRILIEEEEEEREGEIGKKIVVLLTL